MIGASFENGYECKERSENSRSCLEKRYSKESHHCCGLTQGVKKTATVSILTPAISHNLTMPRSSRLRPRGQLPSKRGSATNQQNKKDLTEDYDFLVQKYGRSVPGRTLLKCCSDALPVLQESALSVFFIARYQLSAKWERERTKRRQIEERLDLAHACILMAFLLVLAFRVQKQKLLKNTRNKARHRLTDACLLGVLLRLFASVLRRLTSSYSTDTVEALTMACMGLHMLTCDYTYSSGTMTTKTAIQNRPPFQGGTISLNASFFATVLCISRLESDLTSYFFCSLAVIFFGFYPQTRADLMAEYPPHTSVALWLVTAALLSAAYIVIDNEDGQYAYCLSLAGLLVILPCWRYASQGYKKRFDGPWSLPTDLLVSSRKHSETVIRQ